MSEESKEKRIYVVVAETVQVPSDSVWMERETVSQPPGRIAAQVGHVVSKMRVVRAVRNKELYKPITTIVLAARNTAELDHIAWSLANSTAEVEMFWDENSAAYGDGIKPCTAICTHPIEKDKIELAISHLPLWSPKVAA